jgi:succinoglycan biosynthesis transport protein ExoP
MATAKDNIGLDRLVEIWNRRKWLALAVFVILFTSAACISSFLPDAYRSTVTLLVESQQVPSEFVRSTVTSGVERRVYTIAQAILSRDRLDGLIKEFSLYENLKGKFSAEETIERMRRDILLDVKGYDQRTGSNTTVSFTISYIGDDARKVASVANTLASYFVEEDLKTRERQAGGTAEFLRSQLDEMKKKLDVQEQEVSRFKERHMGELPEQRDANLTTLERLNTQTLLNSEKQIRLRDQKSIIERQLSTSEVGRARPDATADRIAKLSIELADLRRRYSDKYPDVISLKEEIARLRRRLENPEAAGASENDLTDPYVFQLQAALKSADTELRVLAAEEANVRKAIANYQERVENAPRREQEFQELSRDYMTTKEVYSSLLKRYEESKIAESMEYRQKGEQFRILDPAVAADHPNAPDRGRLMLFSLALALAVTIGGIFAAEKLDTSFHDLDDLRSFSRVPVLASIPRIVTEADTRNSRRRFRLGAMSTVAAVGLIIVSSYFIAHNNQTLATMLTKVGGTTGR